VNGFRGCEKNKERAQLKATKTQVQTTNLGHPGKCAAEKGGLIELSENQSCGAKPLYCRKRRNLFGSQGPRWRDRARPQSGNQSGDQPEDCKYDHR
jgi:hypothetical protein